MLLQSIIRQIIEQIKNIEKEEFQKALTVCGRYS